MADEHITWDKPKNTKSKDAAESHITWDKPAPEASVWEAMKKGAKQAFSSENLQDIARQAGPQTAERMAAPIKLATGIAKLPANIANLAGYSDPLKAVNQANQTAEEIAHAGGNKHNLLPGAANLIGEIVSGGGALNLLGKAAAPIQAVLPKINPAIQGIKNSPWAQSILGGSVLGAAGSETNSPMDMAKEGLKGAGAGAIGHTIAKGLGHLMDPELLRIAKMKAAGISDDVISKLSSGQLLGGHMQNLENFLQDLPLGGAKGYINRGKTALNESASQNVLAKDAELYAAKQAIGDTKAAGVNRATQAQSEAEKALELQKREHGINLDTGISEANTGLNLANKKAYDEQRALLNKAHTKADTDLAAHHAERTAALKESESGFHRPFVDRALSSLPKDYQLPLDLKGHELINAGRQSISKAYEDSLKDISSLKLPESVKTELRAIVNQNADLVGGQGSTNHKILEKKVEDLIDSAKNGNWLNPKDWQQKLSDLSKESWASQNPTKLNTDINYGKALGELKDKWIGLIEDQAGSDLFKGANKAYSEFKIPEKAASYLSSLKNSGEANPNDLLRAVSSELSTSNLASGQGEVQQMAEKAYKDMMAKRVTHEASIKADLDKVQAAKDAEKAALDAKFSQAELNVNKQQATNTNLAKEQKQIEADRVASEKEILAAKTKAEADRIAKEAEEMAHAKQLAITKDKTEFQNVVNEAKDMADPNEYWMKRVGYNLGLFGGLGGGTIERALSSTPLSAPAVAGGAYGLSRGIYNPLSQALISKGAQAERPEAVKAVGKVLKENAPLAGLSAVESQQQYRQNPLYKGENVQVEGAPTQEGGLPVPQKAGGRVGNKKK